MSEHPRPQLWGGRFEAELHPTIESFTNSLSFDRRLVRHDVIGSMAHARMLLETGVVAREEMEPVLAGLSGMLEELESGELAVEGGHEDVHSWLEATLGSRIGPGAGRLHTGRSRNDQTSAALRLWSREAAAEVVAGLLEAVDALAGRAREHRESFLPGYTHLQRAQPVSLAHHLLAHAWALLADAGRLRRVHRSAGVSPLGAGALAGSSLPIDPARTAELLGFPEAHRNSLHAVADRDWVAELAFACALLQVHLSRWAEEVIVWTSAEFGFAALPDQVAQGSSLMPQKKNPEAAELVRGKAARTIGHLTAILTLLKGLPLAYNSDLQEDKEAVFDAVDTVAGSLSVVAVMARHLEYRTDRMSAALRGGFLTATDLAEAMVREGVPFREAHERAGRAVLEAEGRGCELNELPAEVLEGCCPGLGEAATRALDPERSARARLSAGGPAPEAVDRQLEELEESVRSLRDWLEALEPPPIRRAHLEGRLLEEHLR